MFFFGHKSTESQSSRVLELLLKHGKVTSLQLSQMHPVILNFHDAIYDLRPFHNIRKESVLVKGKKHTTYFYEGRKIVPERREKVKHYTKEDIINAFNAGLNLEAPNAEAYLQTI